MKKRILSLGLVVALATSLLVGCGGSDNEGGNASNSDVKTYQEVSGTEEEVTLTWWLMGGTEEYAQTYWSEMKSFQQLQANMGIDIEFKVATSYESYLPMMSAQNYPHIITAPNLMRYPGRLDAMFDDGVSIDLTPYMEEGLMPNFSKIVEEYPIIARDIKVDGGKYTFLSTFYDIENEQDRILASTMGLAIRQDWLDAVGKEVPTTMDEWYEVLKAFKTQDPNMNGEADEEPICLASSCWKYFLTAYGIDDDPSVQFDENGKATVVYGYMTPEYKEFLTELNKWNQEELIYNMFRQTSLEAMEQQVTGNISGAWKGGVGHFDESDSQSFISILKDKAPEAAFSACPWPLTEDGYQWNFSEITSFDTETTVITSNAVKDGVDKAAAYFLDYMLSEEASILTTWGIEGESYEVIDGEYKLVEGMDELINYKGKELETFNTYADPLTVSFPSFGHIADYVLSNKNESYVEACTVWSQGDISYKMQAPCQLSVEEQSRIDDIEDGFKNYASKMRMRFIEGKEPLTNYDRYMEQMELLGGNEFVTVWQEAYDGWMSR